MQGEGWKRRVSPSQKMNLSFIDNSSVKGHTGVCTSIGWTKVQKTSYLYSVADDARVLRWNTDSTVHGEILNFNVKTEKNTAQCSALDVSPSVPGRNTQEVIAMGFVDGSIRLYNGAGREERRMENAHRGAVIAVRWNNDGTAFATCGEDCTVRLWSRAGVPRASLPAFNSAVYAVAWSPDSESLALSVDGKIIIRPLLAGANKKILQWKAHEGVALSINWSPVSKLILTGGEDGHFKIFDSLGRQQLAIPAPLDTAITAVAWSPSGRTFAIGSHNHVRLCDSAGWTLSSTTSSSTAAAVAGDEKQAGAYMPSHFGSVYKLQFSPDGGQLAAATASGQVLLAHVSVESANWDNAAVTVDSEKGVIVYRDLTSAQEVKIKETSRVRGLYVGSGKFVTLLPTQLKVYNTMQTTHAALEDLDEPAFFVVLAPTSYALVDARGVHLRTYDCQHICSLQLGATNLRTDLLDSSSLSVSKDSVVVMDPDDTRVLRLFDATTGKPLSFTSVADKAAQGTSFNAQQAAYTHTCPIQMVSLSQNGGPTHRLVAFVDKNREVFISAVQGGSFSPIRIGTVASSIAWHQRTGQLAAVSPDGTVRVWNYPPAAAIDVSLLEATCSVVSVGESFAKAIAAASSAAAMAALGQGLVGSSPLASGADANVGPGAGSGSMVKSGGRSSDGIVIESFSNSIVSIRFQDGTRVCTTVAAHMQVLFLVFERGDWAKALRLCRFLRDPAAWATLAVMSLSERELSTAKHALAALGDLPRVHMLQRALDLEQNKQTALVQAASKAEVAMLSRRPLDAANGFVSLPEGPSVYRAVKSLIKAHEWEAALRMALECKSHIDTVLAYRERFLKALGAKHENFESFRALRDHFGEIDWATVKAKARAEKAGQPLQFKTPSLSGRTGAVHSEAELLN